MAVLPKQNVVVALRGMNQKVPGTIPAPGVLETCENLVSRRGDGQGAFEFIRRNGMTQIVQSGGSNGRLATAYDGLLLRTSNLIEAYSSALGRLTSFSPNFRLFEVDRFDIFAPDAQSTAASSPSATSRDTAFYQGIGCWVWIDELGALRYVIRDTASDAVLASGNLVFSGATHARCVAMGGKFYVFWNEAASSNRIRAQSIDATTLIGGATTTVIAAPLAASDYDIMAGFDATHIALLYRKSAGTHTRVLLDSSYTQTQSTDDATAANQPNVGMCWFHANDASTSGSIWYATINSANFAKVNKISATTLANQSTFSDTSADLATSVNWTGWAGGGLSALFSEVPASPVYKSYVRRSVSGSSSIVAYCALASRAFFASDLSPNVLLLYNSASSAPGPQDTYFLANDDYGTGKFTVVGQALRGKAARREDGHLSSAPADSSGVNHIACQYVVSVESATGSALQIQYGVTDLSFGLGGYRTGGPIEFGGVTLCPGAQPVEFDGSRGALWGDLHEPGFMLYPEPLVLVEGLAASGSIPPGTRSYIARYKWIDRTGQFAYSAWSTPVAITTVNVNSSVQATAWAHSVGARTLVQIEIARTPNNGTGDEYFRVTPATWAGTTGQTQTFTDTASEASLQSGEPSDRSATAEVEPTGLPGVTVFCEHKNRLFGVLSEQPNRIAFSKERVAGRSTEWFDGFVIDTPQNTGPIYALASFDGHLIAIKRDVMYVIDGDFPDANAGGPPIPLPYLLPTGVGTTDPRSVIVTGLGLMFHSRKKGFWLLNRSLQAVYIGAQVEATANTGSVVVSGATVTGDETHARFTSEGGTTFVLDTYFLELGTPVWTTFTGQPCVHSIVHQGRWYQLTSDGKLKVENDIWCDGTQAGEQGTFTPGTEYFAKMTIKDINFAGILGYLRCWRAQLLGQWFGAHKLRMTVTDNHRDISGDVYDFDATVNPDPYILEARIRRQKVTSKRITVEEVTTGSQQTQGAAWTALAFSVGVKPGMSRLPQTKTMTGS